MATDVTFAQRFLTPTGDPNLQVMYITITGGAIAPIAVAALLLNP